MDLVAQPNERVYRCPKPVAQLQHESSVYGPPGDNRLRRLKSVDHDHDHWYLFSRSGLAIARISPQEWAKALAGV